MTAHADFGRASPAYRQEGRRHDAESSKQVTNQHGVHVADAPDGRGAQPEGEMTQPRARVFQPNSRRSILTRSAARRGSQSVHVDLDFAAGISRCLRTACRDGLPRPGTDRRGPPACAGTRPLVAITQLGASLTCEGHVRVVEHNGERCAKLALTTKDENGDIKLPAGSSPSNQGNQMASSGKGQLITGSGAAQTRHRPETRQRRRRRRQ